MKFTFYGQACFLIEVAGTRILFDPFITPNKLAAHIDADSIEADYIFVTHGHADHTADLVAIAKRTGAQVVGAAELEGFAGKNGLTNLLTLNHGGFIDFPFGKVRGVNAIHSSSFADGSYAGNPLGYLFKTAEGDFYIAGDTALTMDMQLIPYWAQPKFAVLPIGGHYTMDAADATLASDFVKCNTVIGVHYNTFPPISIDPAEAQALFSSKGKTLLLPAIGETIEV
jgi:L-ascorbate metabolism protein UlaG (beta-lactamase superfamily)